VRPRLEVGMVAFRDPCKGGGPRIPIRARDQMRAAIFHEHGGPEVVRVESVETPDPGPAEVRIRVRA